MPRRRLPLANISFTSKNLSLRSKVCFGGFIVQIEQMFSCRFYFTGRSCGLSLFSCCCDFLSLLHRPSG